MSRSRWSAIGAAVAVTVGAGGLLQANAADNTSAAALFMATTPCRLVDTRTAPETVGARSVPLGTDDTYTTRVIGANGNCTIPADATTLVMNLTATNQTRSSFLTVYPAGSARPATSSLNWTASSGDVANAVTANVSSSGEVSFYNLAGSTDIVADVVGYYASAPLNNFYTKAQVDALIAANPAGVGPRGEQGFKGEQGLQGAPGQNGQDGVGIQGDKGDTGDTGLTGDPGDKGDPGDTGPAGRGDAAEFYKRTPGDNGNLVTGGGAVQFDDNGPASVDSRIARSAVDEYGVTTAGLYRITFAVPVDQAGQLGISVSGNPVLEHTVVGRATGTTQIVGDSLVWLDQDTSFRIVNPSSGTLTLSSNAGGTLPVVSSLVIELIQEGGLG